MQIYLTESDSTKQKEEFMKFDSLARAFECI